MCLPNATAGFEHVRIQRCPHGTNFVTLGRLTLMLSDAELSLLDHAIVKLAARTPALWRQLHRLPAAADDVPPSDG